jgi:hypothetical protein
VSLLSPPLLYSGWILKDQDGTTTYISHGKIKHVEEDEPNSSLVIDYSGEQVILVDGTRRIYAAGTLEEYCRIMQSMMDAFGQMGQTLGGPDENVQSVEVIAAGQERVAGMNTDKYQVVVDGELYEEVWLTTEPALIGELGNIKSHKKFTECLDAVGEPVESTKAYRELAEKGWELRSISYDFDEKEYNSDTYMIQREEIDESAFVPPASYKRLDLEELFMAGDE